MNHKHPGIRQVSVLCALLLLCITVCAPALALSGLAGKSMDADKANQTVGQSIRERAAEVRLSRAYEQKAIIVIGVSESQSAYTMAEGKGLDADILESVFAELGYRDANWLAQQGISLENAQEALEALGEQAYVITLVEDLPVALMAGEIDLAAGEEGIFSGEEGAIACLTPYLRGRDGVEILSGDKWMTGGKTYRLFGREGVQTLFATLEGKISSQYSSGTLTLLEHAYFRTGKLQSKWNRIQQAVSGFAYEFERNLIREDRYMMLINGLWMTLRISLVSCIAGVLFGSIVALMRLSGSKILRSVSTLYVNVVRGTPVVVQLMIIYYLVLTAPSKPVAAMVTFSVNSAAYVSEMVRGGILAVDKGQTEAGRSLGLNAASTMVLIVLPQTIKIIIPSLFNEFITLLKETSVVGFIGLMDLSKAGDFIRSRTYSPFFPLIAVALIYLLLVTILTRVFGVIEGRLRKSDLR